MSASDKKNSDYEIIKALNQNMGMERLNEENTGIIREIRDHVAECNGIALVNYRSLTVQQDNDLRKFLRDIEVTYKVYKSAYLRKAIENSDFDNLQEYATGVLGSAFFTELKQLGLMHLYCKKTGINCTIEAASYQKKLLLQNDLDQLMEGYVQEFSDLIGHVDAANDKTENLSLYLTNPGESILSCTKVILALTGIGLKESKELAEKSRESKVLIKTFNDEESLLEAQKRFDEIGAKTEV